MGNTVLSESGHSAKPRIKRHTETLRGFDDLPDSAMVRPAVAKDLLGVSLPTLWRWCKNGRLHAIKIGAGSTGIRAGELRKILAGA